MADLFESIAQGDLGAVEVRLADDVEACVARSEQGVSALMMALYHRKREIAEAIARAREQNDQGLDLHELASLGRADELAALLARDDAAIDARSPDGFTALHFAAFFGSPAAAAVLLEHGAAVDPVAANPTRVRPLHSAVASGDGETVALLIEAGADVNANQQNDFTPLMGAAFEGSAGTVKRLLAAGADPSATNEDGKTAQDLAREKGNEEALALL